MKIFRLIMMLSIAAGCAGKPLKEDAREIVFVESISVTPDVAHRHVASYLAKNLRDSNYAIKVNDATAKRIISRIALRCNKLDYALDPNTHFAIYNLEFEAKEGRVRFVFEPIAERIDTAFDTGDEKAPIAGQEDAFRSCAEAEKNLLVKSLTKSAEKAW